MEANRYPSGSQHPILDQRATLAGKEAVQLGSVTYDQQAKKLKLENPQVFLSKKILLLGYSSKANKQNTVGQFGEGMKLGILA